MSFNLAGNYHRQPTKSTVFYGATTKERYRLGVLRNSGLRISGNLISLEQMRDLDCRRFNGSCESCGTRAQPSYPLVLDHNHKTGEFRGILCNGCNTAEGYLKGDPNRADALASYMRRFIQ